MEKRIKKLQKRGLLKRASDLQEYLEGKQRKFFGIMSHKLKDYGEPKVKLPEGSTIEDWQKEERLREQKHLKAYIKGRIQFQHGWNYNEQGYKYPNIIPVLTEPIKNEEVANTESNKEKSTDEKDNTETGTKD